MVAGGLDQGTPYGLAQASAARVASQVPGAGGTRYRSFEPPSSRTFPNNGPDQSLDSRSALRVRGTRPRRGRVFIPEAAATTLGLRRPDAPGDPSTNYATCNQPLFDSSSLVFASVVPVVMQNCTQEVPLFS